MRFYDQQHQFYCGVDLHTKRMYVSILDREGNRRLHRNVQAKAQDFLRAIEPFREDLIVGAECMFTWYWLADLCVDDEPTPTSRPPSDNKPRMARANEDGS